MKFPLRKIYSEILFRRIQRVAVSLVMGCLLTSACGHTYSAHFFGDRALISEIETVAVLSLENLTEFPDAANIVTDLLVTELHHLKKFKVVKQLELAKDGKNKNLQIPKIMDRTVATQIGRQLNADAVFIGSVTEFQYQKDYQPYVEEEEPVVGLNLRLISVRTGTVIWGCSYARSSYEVFAYEKDAISRVTIKALRSMLSSLKEI